MIGFWGRSGERLLTAAVVETRAARRAVEQIGVTVPQRIFDHNRVSRMGPLLERRPVARLGRMAVVTRRQDVLATLEDVEAFPTPYPNGLAGHFVLALSGEARRRGRAVLADVLHDSDQAPLGALAGEVAAHLISERSPRSGAGELAVGADLVHPLLDTVVREYVGLREPDQVTLLAWSRLIFQDIFLNTWRYPSIHDEGRAAAHELAAEVRTELLARQDTDDPHRDDLIGRLLRERNDPGFPFTEQQLVDNIVGLAIGWLWHSAKAALLAVDGLLDRPEALVLARRAARARPEPDLPALRRLVWETLRFRPVQVGLPRVCPAEATVAPRTSRATTIPAGSSVLVATHAAMWDRTAVPDPSRFDATRAPGQYLIFGHGEHRCLGEGIMREQLPAMLAPLLALDGLDRAQGPRGRLSWVGPAPDDLLVQFWR